MAQKECKREWQRKNARKECTEGMQEGMHKRNDTGGMAQGVQKDWRAVQERIPQRIESRRQRKAYTQGEVRGICAIPSGSDAL